MKKSKGILIALLVVIVSAPFFGGCTKANPNLIRISEVTHSIFYAPLYAAINLGYFEDEGLEIELTNANGSQNVMNALTARNPSADIGLHGPEASVYVNVRGKADYPIIFAQLTKRDGSFLLSKDENEVGNFSWDNVIGKRLLAGRKGGMPAMTLQWVVENVGGISLSQLDFDTDTQFADMGTVFRSDSSVSYTTLFEPTASEFQLNGYGYIVASIGEQSGEIPYTAFSACKSYLDKNPDKIRKFIKAIVRAYSYLMESSLDDAAAALHPSFITTDITTVKNVIKNYKDCDAWASSPVMSLASFEKMQDVMVNAGELTTETRQDYYKIVNTSFAATVLAEMDDEA